MVDPHVVWQGNAVLVANVAEISLPDTLRLPPEQIIIFVTGLAVTVQKNTDVDGNVESFTVVGIGTSFDYMVVKSLNDAFCETII